jgi:hypothetical protein
VISIPKFKDICCNLPSGSKLKSLGINIGQETAVASLREDLAPNTCRALWELLPLELPAVHSKVCKFEIMIPTPLICHFEPENMKLPYGSEVAYHPTRSSIDLFYEKIRPMTPTSIIGEIVENRDGLRREGIKLWRKPGVRLRLYKSDEE